MNLNRLRHDENDQSKVFPWPSIIRQTMRFAEEWLENLSSRSVAAPAEHDEIVEALDLPLPESPETTERVIDELVRGAEPGLVASAGPRYFGFVTGGTHPAALSADWLTSTWDQVAASYVGSPSTAVIEDVTARWVLELLQLPRGASVGFVTGATAANLTALAAARQAILAREGWDVEAKGVSSAPPVQIIVGEQRHSTIDVVLRLLGIGQDELTIIPVDEQGRVKAELFTEELSRRSGPAIAILQAGNVVTGAFDPFTPIAAAARGRGAWLHIDGAFGLWARAASDLQDLAAGVENADSWAVDAHKWLNVPYDCGLVIVREPECHLAATRKGGAYAMATNPSLRDGYQWVPEFSRRARGVPVYAAIRALGRSGLENLVNGCCRLASRFAELVSRSPYIEVLNDVVLNQVLLGFPVEKRDERFHTELIVRAVHKDGLFWAGTTEWDSRLCMRVSVSGWSTTEADVEAAAARLIDIVAEAHRQWDQLEVTTPSKQ